MRKVSILNVIKILIFSISLVLFTLSPIAFAENYLLSTSHLSPTSLTNSTVEEKFLSSSEKLFHPEFKAFKEGYYEYQLGNLYSAREKFFSTILQEDFPLRDYSLYFLSEIFRKQGEMDSAAIYSQILVETCPFSFWAKKESYWLGKYYLDSQKPFAAIGILQTSLKTEGLEPMEKHKLLTLLQQALGITGQYSEADSVGEYLSREFSPYRRSHAFDISVGFEEADRLFDSGANVAARKRYSQLLSRARTSEDRARATIGIAKARFNTRYYRNQAKWEKKAAKEIIASLNNLVKQDLSEDLGSEAYYWLGQSYERLGKKASAKDIYEKGLEKFPNGAFADNTRLLLAKEYIEHGESTRSDTLLASISQNLKSDISTSKLLWNLGWSAYLKGDFNRAELIFDILGRTAENYSWQTKGLYWKGRSLEKKGDLLGAKKIFQACADSSSYNYYAFTSKQRLNKLKSEFMTELADSILSQEIEIEKPLLWGDQFWVFWEGLRREKIEDKEIEQIKINGYKNYRQQRIDWLLKLDFYELAFEELEDLRNQYPEDYRYSAQLAWILDQEGKFKESLQLIKSHKNPPPLQEGDYWRLYYPIKYWEVISEEVLEYSLDPLLMLALIHQESLFNPRAYSRARARGLTQVIPSTGRIIARKLEVRPFRSQMLYDPEVSVRFGSYYLNLGMEKSGGNIAVAVAGYNCGVERAARWWKNRGDLEVDEWIETIPLYETRDYVKKVMGNYGAYQELYGKDTFEPQEPELFIPFIGTCDKL